MILIAALHRAQASELSVNLNVVAGLVIDVLDSLAACRQKVGTKATTDAMRHITPPKWSGYQDCQTRNRDAYIAEQDDLLDRCRQNSHATTFDAEAAHSSKRFKFKSNRARCIHERRPSGRRSSSVRGPSVHIERLG